MALIDLKSNLAYNGETVDNIKNDNQTGFTAFRKQGDETEFVQSTRGVDSQFNQNIGGTNTTNGVFQSNQEQNVAGQSNLTDFSRPDVNSTFNKLAPAPGSDLLSTITSGIVGRVVSQFSAVDESVGFLASPKGALFVGKQIFAQKKNPFSFTRRYDILSVPKSLARGINEVPRHKGGNKSFTIGPEEAAARGSLAADDITYKDLQKVNQDIIFSSNRSSRTTPGRRLSTKITDEKLSYGLRTPTYLEKESELSEDFIKFWVKDPQTSRIVQLPAYLTDITDNSSAEFSPTRYIGRADQVYVYSGYNRSVSFGFRVAALTRGDVPMIWRKIGALKSMTLPAYEDNVIQNDNELRPVAPFVELTIGNYFVNQPGFFSSVNVTIPQNSSWETEKGYELTHIADVSLEFTYIGKQLPRLTGKQYDIEYEQDVARERELTRIKAERLIAQDKLKEEGIQLNPKIGPSGGIQGATGTQRTQGFGTALGGTPGLSTSPLPTSLRGDD